MDLSRRKFLQIAGISLATSALPAWAKNSSGLFTKRITPFSANPQAIPILQGPTDHESTTLILLHNKEQKPLFKISDNKGSQILFQSIQEWPLPGSKLMITQLILKNLSVNLEYTLDVMNTSGTVFDQRTFRTLNTAKNSCKFALISCMKDNNEDDVVEIWETLYRQNCDFVILDGDTCYSDNDNSEKTEASYARRYAESRSRIGWFKAPSLTPTFATWDDHDAGANNADKSLAIMPYMRQLFRKFWGDTELTNWKKAFGVGSVFTGFGQKFYLLDDRSFRDAPGAKNARQLGSEQSDWLISELNKEIKPSWLIDGSQFFGGYRKKDGYEYDHPEDFKNLLLNLKKSSSPVVFASGDVHYSEVMQIEERILGYQTYEFTSSSVHSTTFPFNDSRRGKNEPRRLNSEWRHNFMVLESDRTQGWNIKASVVKRDGSLSFSNAVTVKR